MTQRIRVLGAVAGLLLLGLALSACGGTPVAQYWPGLTVAGDTVYAISGAPQQVYLLDAETGAQKGTFMPTGDWKGTIWWSPVTVVDGVAFVGFTESATPVSRLYAFDPQTGQEQWYVPAESMILPAPTYADSTVYFGSSDGRVYAVDVETRGVKPGWPFEATDAIWASPLVIDGRVYVAAMDHHVYALDAETGAEIWKAKVGAAMAAPATLVASSGVLYVGAFDGKVYAIEAESGEILEDFDFQAKSWVWSKVLVGDEQLFVTALDGYLYALDPTSGSVIPPYPYNSGAIDDQDDRLRASPVEAGDFVVVASESGRVIAVKDAQAQWVWPSGTPVGSILTTPVVAGDKVYVVLMDGQVQTLDAESGVPGWSFSPPEAN